MRGCSLFQNRFQYEKKNLFIPSFFDELKRDNIANFSNPWKSGLKQKIKYVINLSPWSSVFVYSKALQNLDLTVFGSQQKQWV